MADVQRPRRVGGDKLQQNALGMGGGCFAEVFSQMQQLLQALGQKGIPQPEVEIPSSRHLSFDVRQIQVFLQGLGDLGRC